MYDSLLNENRDAWLVDINKHIPVERKRVHDINQALEMRGCKGEKWNDVGKCRITSADWHDL